MANPNIQIDDEVREMTDEEFAEFMANNPNWVETEKPTAKK